MEIETESVPENGPVDLLAAKVFRSHVTGKSVIQAEITGVFNQPACL